MARASVHMFLVNLTDSFLVSDPGDQSFRTSQRTLTRMYKRNVQSSVDRAWDVDVDVSLGRPRALGPFETLGAMGFWVLLAKIHLPSPPPLPAQNTLCRKGSKGIRWVSPIREPSPRGRPSEAIARMDLAPGEVTATTLGTFRLRPHSLSVKPPPCPTSKESPERPS